MNPAEIDAIIATEVMAWKSWEGFYFKDNIECGLVSAYHPTSNVAQAFEALDRLCKNAKNSRDRLKYHIYNNLEDDDDDTNQIDFYYHHGDKFIGIQSEHKILSMAISLAIADYLKAEGKV
jgi:hypothetical protein